MGEGFEGVGGFAEGFEGGEGVGDEFVGVFEGLVDAVDGGPGGFDAGGVFAGGLAEFFGALGHVEDVVDDLEGEAGFFAEGAEAAMAQTVLESEALGGTRISCRGRRRPPETMLVVMRAPVLARWMASTSSAVGGDAFGFDVDDLAADHAGRKWVSRSPKRPTPVPTARETSRRMATTVAGAVGSCGDGLEGEGLEGVAGEDGDGFAEDDVAGGLAAAEVVVVEGGEVVVDEGVGVEHLEGCAEVGCAFGEVTCA